MFLLLYFAGNKFLNINYLTNYVKVESIPEPSFKAHNQTRRVLLKDNFAFRSLFMRFF